MATIPASDIATVTPSVLSAGGASLVFNGLVLTNSFRVPIGTVASLSSASAVGTYFGLSSNEYAAANTYFAGYNNSSLKPTSMLFAQYPSSPVAAYLRSGSVSGLTLSQLQAISGTLAVTIDGYPHSAASVNLSAATSFSSAATIIGTALNATEPTEATVTGSFGASFTATGTGTSFVVTSVTGYISAGDVITGTGVPAGTTIVSQSSGTTGGAGTYITSVATTASAAACTTTSTVLDVTAVASGVLAVGQTIAGSGVTTGTVITALITGSGGIGLYNTNISQKVASETVTGVATAVNVIYDSVSGSFIIISGIQGTPSTAAYATGTAAASLYLTAATGAVLSQGAAAATPSAFMTSLTQITQNWVSFTTDFDPDSTAFIGSISGTTLTVASVTSGTIAIGQTIQGFGVTSGTTITAGSGLSWTVSNSMTTASAVNMLSFTAGGASGNTQKLAFANWTNAQNNRYVYVCADTDISPTLTLPATTCLGYLLQQSAYSGTALIYDPTQQGLNYFISGSIASLNFSAVNGRDTFAFMSQSGLTPTVTNATVAHNLAGSPQAGGYGNGYNFYGAYATANQQFNFYQRGTVSGLFLWLDSFVNQIWMNNAFQLDLVNLLSQVASIPYNNAGASMIAASLQSTINQALSYGAINVGVALSSLQTSQVNTQAGLNIATILQNRGWYLQVLTASAATRAARTSPPCTFWYTDGGSIQAISLNSVEVQ